MGNPFSFLEKPFRTGASAKKRAEDEAEAAARAAGVLSAKNAEKVVGMGEDVRDSYSPLINSNMGNALTGSQSLADLFATSGDANAMPDEAEVYGMSDDYMQKQARNAAQFTRGQFANSARGIGRQFGASSGIKGSGNMQGALSGAMLNQDRAASRAGLSTLNQLSQQDMQSRLGQKRENSLSRFNYDVTERQRADANQLNQARYLSAMDRVNPGLDMIIQGLGGQSSSASNNASILSGIASNRTVQPGAGTQMLSSYLGSL